MQNGLINADGKERERKRQIKTNKVHFHSELISLLGPKLSREILHNTVIFYLFVVVAVFCFVFLKRSTKTLSSERGTVHQGRERN